MSPLEWVVIGCAAVALLVIIGTSSSVWPQDESPIDEFDEEDQ